MGDCAPLFSSDCSPSSPLSLPEPQKKRKMILYDDDEEEVNQVSLPLQEEDEEEDEEVGENVKPIGDIIRVSFIEGYRRDHYYGFQANGASYELVSRFVFCPFGYMILFVCVLELQEDVVLVVPDEVGINMKPSVAMIKDISATQDGMITVTGQRFYRLEVAVNENGKKWKSSESRELFYSFDKTEFSADLVLHKCRVHFIPPNKEIPRAKDHPGFIVRRVYDSKYKELTELLDTGYDDCKQHEINLLVEKTICQNPSIGGNRQRIPKSSMN
ncbi:putative BAH domain-containing protein [Helianthus annuus]|nr:putative BAH domain-containing protein [Helianthus annuus]